MKVMVVGAGGYIGRLLARDLYENNIDVIRVTSADGNGINSQTGILPEDFTIPDDTDVIVYLAQSPYYRELPERSGHLFSANVLSAIKVAELGRKAGINRYIYTSTGNVYSPSLSALREDSPLCRTNWYSLSKIHAEEALSLYREYFDVTIARLFGVYGPGQTDKLVPSLLNAVNSNNPIFLDKNPENENDIDGMAISLCYIDDIIKIIRKFILESGPEVINVAGNEIISIRRIVETLCNLLDKPVGISISDNYRKSNLIADTSLISDVYKNELIRFDAGMKAVANEAQERTNIR